MSLWKKLGFDELWETFKEVVKDVQEFDRKVDEKTKKWRAGKRSESRSFLDIMNPININTLDKTTKE